jgi:hypothetical protein
MVFTDPEMVLTWFLAQLGASNCMIGLIAPVRIGGWFFPQFFVAEYLQRQPRKLPLYRTIAIVRSVLMLRLVLCVALVPADGPWLLPLFFVFFVAYSLCTGLAEISLIDMVSRVIPPARRGTFFGQRMFLGNVIALGASALIGLCSTSPTDWYFPQTLC